MNTPTSPTLQPSYLEAPLVHLIDTDPAKLSPTELQAYLEQLRAFRGNPATRKAATEQKEKKNSSGKAARDLSEFLD